MTTPTPNTITAAGWEWPTADEGREAEGELPDSVVELGVDDDDEVPPDLWTPVSSRDQVVIIIKRDVTHSEKTRT